MAKLNIKSKDGLLQGRWTLFIFGTVLTLAAGFGTYSLIGKVADQIPYYVLKANVAARVQINASMLQKVSANVDGVPPTALSLGALARGNLFTKIALHAGDVLTSSVVGSWQPLTANLPAGYLVSSIKVAPENAVAGKISAGDYIDIATTSSGGKSVAKVILHHVLVLDVSVDASNIATAANARTVNQSGTGPDAPAIYSGIPSMYTLAVSTNDFLVLTATRNNSLYLALSSNNGSGSLANGYLDSSSIFAAGGVPDSGAVLTPTPTTTPIGK